MPCTWPAARLLQSQGPNGKINPVDNRFLENSTQTAGETAENAKGVPDVFVSGQCFVFP